MIDFANEAGKKSDYNLFTQLVQPYLTTQNAFSKMKEGLFTKGLNKQIDDQTIINIYKN